MRKIGFVIFLALIINLCAFSQDAKDNKTLVINGVFGIKSAYADQNDFMKYAKELSKDKHFYSLIVVMVSRHDYGLSFTYISSESDAKQKVSDYMKKMYDKFGGRDICVAMENWGNYPLSDNPIIVLKGYPETK